MFKNLRYLTVCQMSESYCQMFQMTFIHPFTPRMLFGHHSKRPRTSEIVQDACLHEQMRWCLEICAVHWTIDQPLGTRIVLKNQCPMSSDSSSKLYWLYWLAFHQFQVFKWRTNFSHLNLFSKSAFKACPMSLSSEIIQKEHLVQTLTELYSHDLVSHPCESS